MADRGQLGNTSTNPPMTRADGSAGSPGRGMGTYSVKEGVKPDRGPHSLTETHLDDRDPTINAKLYEEMVGFKNLATSKEMCERAKSAVLQGLKDTFNVNEFLRNKWLILYRLYRGETLNEYQYGRVQQHSPTPYRTVETIHHET